MKEAVNFFALALLLVLFAAVIIGANSAYDAWGVTGLLAVLGPIFAGYGALVWRGIKQNWRIQAGHDAYVNGQPHSSNPFDRGTDFDRWCDWSFGWHSAARQK